MGRKTKCIFYTALTFIFMLLMADFVPIRMIPHNENLLDCECPDFSKNGEHSHAHNFEDEVFCNDSHSSQYRPAVSKDFLLSHNLIFKDSYSSIIWQPPKIS